ncbi:peptidase inhibitor family I36 protein [Streptomyces sp. NPDC058195]|uniref:peptidase inhibitor family I36 protein n=1 Tax=Streptomyces sp. NPDC058195 TaxID=3346375 RepID=UPI0036E1835E
MTTRFPRPGRIARAAASAIAAVAVALLPGSASANTAAYLPPGVVKLQDSEPCPPATLCLYRDYNDQGPAYGIGAGFPVDLHALPMSGGVHGPSAANEVSSWVNNTSHVAVLLDADSDTVRPLFPHQLLQEPPRTNDTVDFVAWG